MRIDGTRRAFIGSWLVLVVLCFQQAPAGGQEGPRQTSLLSPSFGIGPDQRATFTLFLTAGEPVRARVTLHDGRGEVVAESGEAEVRAGAFHSFRFDPGDIHMAGEDGTGRRQLRASCWIRVSHPWGRIGDVDAVLEITSFQTGVTDGTSNTFFAGEELVRPLHGGGAPALTSRAAGDVLVGIAAGQTLRVSAFAVDAPAGTRTAPLRMHVNVYDEDGTVVATSRQVDIAAGHFGSVDIARRDLPVTGESGRAQVRVKPLFALGTNDLDRRVVTSLETVDSAGNTVDGPQCLVFFLGGNPGD